MKLTLSSSPHQRAPRTTNQVMRLVIYAMLPGMMLQTLYFGWGVLLQALVAMTAAVLTEGVILAIRRRPVEPALSDCSALLTGLLLAVSLPPLLPWWMTVIGTFFAIAIVKQLYGGLGFNLFNPAMAAYVMLLISFPGAMTQWSPAQAIGQFDLSIVDAASVIFTGFTQSGYDIVQIRAGIDGVTMATPLDSVKTALTQSMTYQEALQSDVFAGGLTANSASAFSYPALAYLAGGLILMQLRVISWHIPFSMLGAILVVASVVQLIDPSSHASGLFHLLNGAAIFGAFFIATDPVSASTTRKGRLVFGAAIGFWVVIIRTYGGYPDAVAFAVLVMNMAVPLIDYYTQPRTYGHSRQTGKGGR